MIKLITMEEKIKEFLGYSTKDRQVYEFKPGTTTIYIDSDLTLEEWCKEFNIGLLHGKSIVHFG